MLTKLTIRNFKQFGEVEIPLANGMVFIGPNNSGKTSALQALALWHTGLQTWADKRLTEDSEGNLKMPKKRPGVTINRQNLLAIPVAQVGLLWRNLRLRSGYNTNVRIELVVEGVSPQGENWEYGLEFDYASPDTIHCRPLRTNKTEGREMLVPPDAALNVEAALLPPMSGLSANEAELQPGRINVLLGEGQTAQVLRNKCYQIYSESEEQWDSIVSRIEKLFGVHILDPERVVSRGEIRMRYTEQGKGGAKFDLPSSGRGLQQVLLLLAFLSGNRQGTTLLVDEPDAHLEILRQQSIYQALSETADERGSQVFIASHSEILLREAAARNTVVAFVGKPHLLAAGRTDEVLKALKEFGFDQYYLAEQKGWVLYLEGETDLKILHAFAERLSHPALDMLEAPFYKCVGNQPDIARRHFYALREARSDLVGVLLVDSDVRGLQKNKPLVEMQWQRREMENYLCSRRALIAYITSSMGDDLWTENRRTIMEREIEKLEAARKIQRLSSPFSRDVKASNETLETLFENFAEAIGMRQPLLRKADFYKLVPCLPEDEIDPEIVEKLDAIYAVAKKAKTPQDDPDA